MLDSTYVFALPYAGGLLADMGAEVIKVEGPGRPDVTRTGGYSGVFAENDVGEDWWNRPSTYNLIHRGKQSITLDMTDERGRELFKELVMVSDVVMENFTPRVMRSWGLDYPNMRKLRPDVILVSNTGYGHGGGPYSGYPAQATTQEATHGHCWVTGYPGEGPAKAGASFVDFLSTWTALFAIGAALRYRSRDRFGPVGGHGHVPGRGDVPVGVHPGRHGQRARGRAHRQPPPVAGAAGLLSSGGGRPVDHAVGGRRLAVAVAVRRDGAAGAGLGSLGSTPSAGGGRTTTALDEDHHRVDVGAGPVRHDACAADGGHPVRGRC